MENLAQYLAAVLGKEEKMWVLFLNSFILALVLYKYIIAWVWVWAGSL